MKQIQPTQPKIRKTLEWWEFDPNDKEQVIELLQHELESRNSAAAKALDQLWNDILVSEIPNYGDWEYPAQAYRHLLAAYRKLQADAGGRTIHHVTEGTLRTWIADSVKYLHHWHSCTWENTASCSCGLGDLIERMKKITIK